MQQCSVNVLPVLTASGMPQSPHGVSHPFRSSRRVSHHSQVVYRPESTLYSSFNVWAVHSWYPAVAPNSCLLSGTSSQISEIKGQGVSDPAPLVSTCSFPWPIIREEHASEGLHRGCQRHMHCAILRGYATNIKRSALKPNSRSLRTSQLREHGHSPKVHYSGSLSMEARWTKVCAMPM